MTAADPPHVAPLPPDDYSIRTGCSVGLIRAGRADAKASSLRGLLHAGDLVRSELLRHGALLLRGFEVRTVPEFESLWGNALRPRRDYRYMWNERGRRRLGAFAVNSNYTRAIGTIGVLRFHHENLHLPRAESPEWIAFGCLKAAERGGETAVVDTAAAFDDLPPALQSKLLSFSQKYRLEIPSAVWGEELGSADEPGAVEACQQLGYRVLRSDRRAVVVTFERPCVERHRLTGRRSILLDRSSYGVPSDFWMAFRAYYGDRWLSFRLMHGAQRPFEAAQAAYRFYKTRVRNEWVALDRKERAELSKACAAHVAAVRYEPGDVLLVDNLLLEHTALPWAGDREIVVAMGDYPTA